MDLLCYKSFYAGIAIEMIAGAFLPTEDRFMHIPKLPFGCAMCLSYFNWEREC